MTFTEGPVFKRDLFHSISSVFLRVGGTPSVPLAMAKNVEELRTGCECTALLFQIDDLPIVQRHSFKITRYGKVEEPTCDPVYI